MTIRNNAEWFTKLNEHSLSAAFSHQLTNNLKLEVMREIKFRVWDLEKKCWIENNGTTFNSEKSTEGQLGLLLSGNLRVFYPHCYEPSYDENGKMIEPATHGIGNSEYNSVHPCHTEPTYKTQYVLQQFTGLTDKNGKEIWEGDICNYPFKNFNGKIEFDDGGFCITHNAVCKAELNTASAISIEVIGNSFENPELINSPTT